VLLAGLVWVSVALWPKDRADTGRRAGSDSTKGTDVPTALAEKFTNSLGMKLVLVKPGRFQMGCPTGEDGSDAEKPQHWVEMTQPFYVGVTEVTQEQYEQVIGTNPSHFTPTGKGKDYVQGMDTRRFPVENVSWDDAVEFCRRLTAREKDKGRRYRLPLEAEWEYACRGGHKYKESVPFYFLKPSPSLDGTRANFDGGHPYGVAAKTPPLLRTAPVGSYPPNALGLFDMHGNVYEWCADDQRAYHKEEIKDPAGKTNTSRHIIRGGSWGNTGKECRAAHRAERDDARGPRCWPQIGFRVVCLP
jgi:formylglycine-generating enzyme required for sulfatase activity